MAIQVGQVAARASDEIVQAINLVPAGQQPVTKMRTDETGDPRYQMSQFVSSSYSSG
jgi:hypothetical protein